MKRISKILPIVLIIILVGLIAAVFVLMAPRFPQVRTWISDLKIGPQSQVRISATNVESSASGKVKLEFTILPSDRSKLEAFSGNLGIDSSWTNGLEIVLNQESLAKIRPLLPVNLNLRFKDKELDLSSDSRIGLNSALPERNFEFSTGSGKLVGHGSGTSKFELSMTDPAVLLTDASRSGTFFVGKNLNNFVPILEKVATIYLKVSDRQINGSILLK